MKWVWFCLFFAISAWAAEGDTVYIDVVKRDTVYIDVPQKIDTVYYDPAEDIPKEGSSSSTNASLHTVYLHYDLGSLLATAVCESPILVAQVEFALGRHHSLMVPASFLKISPNSKFVSSFDSDDYSGSVYQFTLGLAYRYYTTEKSLPATGTWKRNMCNAMRTMRMRRTITTANKMSFMARTMPRIAGYSSQFARAGQLGEVSISVLNSDLLTISWKISSMLF